MRLPVLTLALVVILGGCVSNVSTKVTTFSAPGAMPTIEQPKTLAILAFPEERNNSLEFKVYRGMLKDGFEQHGYRVIEDWAIADQVAFVSYEIDDGKTTSELVSTPTYGQIGGGTTTNYYSTYGAYLGSSYQPSQYGVTGYQYSTQTRTTYKRQVKIDIFEGSSMTTDVPEKVFEATLLSSGSCNQISAIFPFMAKSLFQEFPGSNGQTVKVDLPSDGLDC